MATVGERVSGSSDAVLPELSPQAELVVLARALFREGYDDHIAGHITYRQPDGSLLVNPWELAWDELTVGDVMRIDDEGNVLEGTWSVTPGVALQLEVHRSRPDVVVAVHNHSRWGTIWCDLHRAPPVYDQTAAAAAGPVPVYKDYRGPVDLTSEARAAVAVLGSAGMALLGNHGVLVVGASVSQAHHRCVTLEWRCRQAWHVEALGGGVPMDPAVAETLGRLGDDSSVSAMTWRAMARRELRNDPSLLSE